VTQKPHTHTLAASFFLESTWEKNKFGCVCTHVEWRV